MKIKNKFTLIFIVLIIAALIKIFVYDIGQKDIFEYIVSILMIVCAIYFMIRLNSNIPFLNRKKR